MRQRSTAELPAEVHPRPLFRDQDPSRVSDRGFGPEPAVPGWRDGLRPLRWELAALAAFVVGPLLVGLLALFVGAAIVARSTFWDVRDKVRALLGIPAAAVLAGLIWAWAEATQFSELESSASRLRAAGDSLADSGQYAVPVLGLLVAARLGYLVLRDGQWGETGRHSDPYAG